MGLMQDTLTMRRTRVTISLVLVVLVGATQLGAVQAVSVRSLAHGSFGQVLTVSKSKNLPAKGSWVTVTGNGYDERVGIYVTMCVRPAKGQLPTPCGGGINKTGSSAASVWVSSNAPNYGAGLAKPFGIGGKFKVRLFLGPHIGKRDCRKIQCVIATRADHLQTSNRTADVFIPVTFNK
jgi:hypothetical protein